MSETINTGQGLNISTTDNTINPNDFTRLDIPVTPEPEKPSRVIETNRLADKYTYFKPKFSSSSRRVLETPPKPEIQTFAEEKVKSQNDRIMEMMDMIKNLKQNPKIPQKKSYLDELERLQDQFDETSRKHMVNKKKRKVYDKMFMMKTDQAIALVKANRGPTEEDMQYALNKYGGPRGEQLRRTGRMATGLRPQQQQAPIMIRRNNRRRPESSSSESSSSEEEEQQPGLTREEIEQRAQALVDKKLRERLPPRAQPQQQPQFAGPQNPGDEVIQLPNGMTLIKSGDPNQPPIILAPEDVSEKSSKLTRSGDRWNPMNEYVNNMMTLKMMQLANKKKPKKEKKPESNYEDF